MDENALPPTPSATPTASPLLSDLRPLRSGDLCPNCNQGKLDYNGLLELECLICGYRSGGSGGGCT